MLRVLIVEAEDSTRSLIRQIFDSQEGFAVCAEAKSNEEAVKEAEQRSPDLIVWDLSAPVSNGLDFFVYVRVLAPKAFIFLIVDEYDSALEKKALDSGVMAVFSKKDDLSVMVQNARAIFGA
jgi:DNA-binding NarL/FixJ family response regulator